MLLLFLGKRLIYRGGAIRVDLEIFFMKLKKKHNSKKNLKIIFFSKQVFFFIFAVFALQCIGTDRKSTEVPIATKCVFMDGLKLRENPSPHEKTHFILKYGESLNIYQLSNHQDLINGIQSNWSLVEFNGTKGWVFSAYLKENCPSEKNKYVGLIRLNHNYPIFHLQAKNSEYMIGNIYKTKDCSEINNQACIYTCAYEAGGGSCSITSFKIDKNLITIQVALKKDLLFVQNNEKYICMIENSEELEPKIIFCDKR